jgi:hypothetical protein
MTPGGLVASNWLMTGVLYPVDAISGAIEAVAVAPNFRQPTYDTWWACLLPIPKGV